MRNLIRALRGKPVELSPKQEAKMAAAQARADAMIAEREEAGRQAMAEATPYMPAGAPTELPTQLPPVGDMVKQAFESARDSFGEMFDDRAGIIDRPPDADMNRPPPELEDPQERERVAAEERAARERARAPYLAPALPAVERTRFATTGRTQLDDVVARLRTAAPDRVYGVYRVPDRGDLNRNSENKAALEWEIAHAPGAFDGADEDVLVTAFNRAVRWVARRPGDPAVFDEDVAGTLCARAGLQPEECFGLARLMHVRGSDSDNGKFWRAHVDGVLVISRASDSLARAYEEMVAEAPIALPAQPVLPFHAEILDWEAVAAWVAPDRHGPHRTPSPLPHLPSSWEELMTAYLEVVGVRSEDCYGVQVTRADSERSLTDLSLASARRNLRGYPKLIHAAEHVVIAYRDRDEYREGRDRWRAYQQEVLDARLDHRTGARPPLEADEHPRQSFLSEVFDFVNPLDPLNAPPQIFNRNERPSLGPYCGTVEE